MLQDIIAICHSEPNTTTKKKRGLGNPQLAAKYFGEFTWSSTQDMKKHLETFCLSARQVGIDYVEVSFFPLPGTEDSVNKNNSRLKVQMCINICCQHTEVRNVRVSHSSGVRG